MSVATLAAPVAAARSVRAGEIDNRAAYAGFGLAYVLGHGAAAVSYGSDPLLPLPGWLPTTLLVGGLVAGTAGAIVASTRAQRGAAPDDVTSGRLLGAAWATAFVALFLAITGLTTALDVPELQSVLWPTGSGLVVGLLYLGEGAARRNMLHYALGTWLSLISTAALFLPAAGPFVVLAVAGGGAYLLATVLEKRRLR